MTKLSQIESALRAINPARFQSLCDAYLLRLGYERPSAVGLVPAAEKVARGTPDTFFVRPDGRFVFAEYTTQQDNVFDKLKGDLARCFDEAKTGIPVRELAEVVLCHTSLLSAGEERALSEECQRHGCSLRTYGISALAHDLYYKHRELARDFLGVAIDSGQVVTSSEFVAAYNKGRLATPLDTAFQFRESDIAQALQSFKRHDLLLIAGRAGIGKTRLALECCDRYQRQHKDVQVRCIDNRGVSIYEDLRVHFAAPGQYIILVDDANRFDDFPHILRLLHDQDENHSVKVIATVRQYALSTVRAAAADYGAAEVILDRLKDEEIRKLVRNVCGILDPYAQERISDVAHGNPRLAVMAGRVAAEAKTYESIVDVTAVYDAYFGTVLRDLAELSDLALLRVAALVGCFGVLDRANVAFMRDLGAFGISPDVFWDAVRRLQQLEVLDVHADQVAKVSDQVLATYLFYRAFVRDNALDLGVLLDHFFPRFRHRIVDALYPVVSTFDARIASDVLRPHIKRLLQAAQSADDTDAVLNLLDTFWFVAPTETLLIVRDRIHALSHDHVDPASLLFAPATDVPTPSLLSILMSFRGADEADMRIALELLLEYVERQPMEAPHVLHILTEDYGFRLTSYVEGFTVERVVHDMLCARARGGEDLLMAGMLIAVSAAFLRVEHHTMQSHGREVRLTRFQLPAMPELLALRRGVWREVLALHSVPALRVAVQKIVESYSPGGIEQPPPEIAAVDAEALLPFISAALDPYDVHECQVARGCLDTLARHGVDVGMVWERFSNETHSLAALLVDDREERSELGWEEAQERKRSRLREHLVGYDADQYAALLRHCAVVRRSLTDGHSQWKLQNGVAQVLGILANLDPALLAEVLGRYLDDGDPLDLAPMGVAWALVRACGPEQAHQLLAGREYPTKNSWLFAFFQSLSPEQATSERRAQLMALYDTASPGEVPADLNFLERYATSDGIDAVLSVAEVLVKKAHAFPGAGRSLEGLFSSYSTLSKGVKERFAGHVELLKQAYLVADDAAPHSDLDATGLSSLIDLDREFVREYLDHLYSCAEPPNRHHDHRDYTALWKREDWAAVLTDLVERVYECERDRLVCGSYVEVFFARREGKDDPVVADRQEEVLGLLIDRRHDESDFVAYLFGIAARLGPDHQRRLIGRFVDREPDLSSFERLPLEPRSSVWWGSEVPVLERMIAFLESLRALFGRAELLGHRHYVERQIERLKKGIERARREDFIER
jgi:hypothetical protein